MLAYSLQEAWGELDPFFRAPLIIGAGLGAVMIIGILAQAIYKLPQWRREAAAYPLFREEHDPRAYALDKPQLDEAYHQDEHRRRDLTIEEEEISSGGATLRGRASILEASANTASERRRRERREEIVSDQEKLKEVLRRARSRPIYGLDKREWWNPKSMTIRQEHEAKLRAAILRNAYVALQGKFERIDGSQGRVYWRHQGTIGPTFLLETTATAAVPYRNLDEVTRGVSACYGWIRDEEYGIVHVSVIAIFK